MPPSSAPVRAARRRLPVLIALVAVAAAGCDGGGERESPAAELAVSQATDDAVSGGESARRIAAYRLTTERVERWFSAQDELDALVAGDPGLEARLRGARTWRGGEAALDDAAARLEREPEVRAAIEDAGLSTRDFVMTALALHQALLAAGPGGPPELRRLAARNVRFVSENGEVLRRYADGRPGVLAAADSLRGSSDEELTSFVDSLWAADTLAPRDTLDAPAYPLDPPPDSLPAVPPDSLAPPVLPAPVVPRPVIPPVDPTPAPPPPVPSSSPPPG